MELVFLVKQATIKIPTVFVRFVPMDTLPTAGICYLDDDEEEAFPWLYVAGIGAALVLVLS